MLNKYNILTFILLMLFTSTTYLHANNLTTQIQIMLNELNFNAGSPDGIYGKKNKGCSKQFLQEI
jgi:peptidoglycan hydrolase-like protein with peptidoglycan-binding domain